MCSICFLNYSNFNLNVHKCAEKRNVYIRNNILHSNVKLKCILSVTAITYTYSYNINYSSLMP